ncbi:DUF3800 domain-containing protein [Clostridium sp. WILCCON 0269]|uniref:DUF3800 domain-containing protein n=1 Tax=Candidatus Clostridium eludens TaxID=3381663 RepID=A0ABW8SJZ4_9CLOT
MHIYIDESGSMTTDSITSNNRYFIIAILLVAEPKKLRRVYERFISKYFDDLKESDKNGKMFRRGKFVELKGSSLTPEMKKIFLEYFCRNNHFQILYIKVDNSKVTKNFYKNKARAFNYVLKLALENLYNSGVLTDRNWALNIDERNVKADERHQLREHLLTEFIGKDIVDEIQLEYFDSSNNKLIQLADVFSNLYYSNILTNNSYKDEIQYMIDNKYLLSTFIFPLL